MKKKSILWAGLFCCFVCVNALHAQLRYGLKAGVVLADMPFNATDEFYYNGIVFQEGGNPRMTFLAGGIAELDLRRNWTLSVELQLSGKGYLEKGNGVTSDFEEYAARLWYVQLPVAANFRWSGFFMGAGPYAGIGLAGKIKATRATAVDNFSVAFGNDEESDLRRFDAGVYVQIGYSFRNFRLSFGGQFGLTNAIPAFYANSTQFKARQQSMSVAAAYYFGAGE